MDQRNDSFASLAQLLLAPQHQLEKLQLQARIQHALDAASFATHQSRPYVLGDRQYGTPAAWGANNPLDVCSTAAMVLGQYASSLGSSMPSALHLNAGQSSMDSGYGPAESALSVQPPDLLGLLQYLHDNNSNSSSIGRGAQDYAGEYRLGSQRALVGGEAETRISLSRARARLRVCAFSL